MKSEVFEDLHVPPFDETELTSNSTQEDLCSVSHCDCSIGWDCGECLFHRVCKSEFESWKRQKLEQLENE